MDGYTVGEIFRKELLRKHNGEPYTSKAAVSVALKGQPFVVKKTQWGEAKVFTQATIDALNNRWK